MQASSRAALNLCPRVGLQRLGSRAFYSTGVSKPTSASGGEVKPLFIDYPTPTIGEYRYGVPPQTGVKNIARATKVTTLANGLKVATLTANDIGASLGLYVNAGTRDESRASSGVNHVLKFAAFGASSNKASYEVVRELEAAGATLNASSGREHLLFSTEFPPSNKDVVLPIISDLLHPKLAYHELISQKDLVQADKERLEADPVASLLDLVHRVAYRSKGLGQSLVANDVHHITRATLSSWVSENYVPSKAVVVGVGLEHEELVKSVEAAFANKPEHKKFEPKDDGHHDHEDSHHHSEPAVNKVASKYAGGETLVPASGNTHLALAFEGASLKGDVKETLAFGVLQHILGSIVIGNAPAQVGTGVTSRLAKNVAPNNQAAHVISAFNFSYSDSGLFGVYAETHNAPGRLASSIVSELAKLRSPLSNDELTKGKNLFKLSVLDQGSRRTPALEFIGAQVLTSGKALTPEEYAAQIDNLTAADVAAVAKKVLSSRPTFVAVGDVSNLPSFEEISSSLKA